MIDVDLFQNIDNNNVLELLKCIGIKTKTFRKNSTIVKAGSKIDFLGVILEGRAIIRKPDNNMIIEKLKVNDIFGHNIVCCNIIKSPIDIIAENKCEVFFLPFEKVITPCSKVCSYHIQLIKNILKMISERNSLLSDKIDIIGQRTTKDKVISLLRTYKKDEGSFSIPYSREEMAKFLCVDRSALSRELSKMQEDGIIRFKKNQFELLI